MVEQILSRSAAGRDQMPLDAFDVIMKRSNECESKATTKRWSNVQKATATLSRKPKLGQNFLTDIGAIHKIVDALGDVSQKMVVEIGPGRGALTDVLANRAARLVAVELDRVLSAQLRMKYATRPNVEVIEADVLTVDFHTMLGKRPGPLRDLRPTAQEKVRVVGNLPYYITSDILLALFAASDVIESIVVMLQLEVADRIAAKPGSSEYGLLSATAQLYTKVEKLFTLPPEAFQPPPKVHSAVLRLTVAPRIQELGVDEKKFVEFLKLTFAQKRKTLFNNLRDRYEGAAVKRAMADAGLKSDVRAEAINLDKAAKLFHLLEAATQAH
ncbi:MAG TPA: 16S rRNA (adenine(1518)-N(6)/adenine(1519)-N(6))-dimethyltransferase RsmA [Clostridia bacterium]|nr:16S rRNA (adenine(1518)-N(6)/adenine(1519)-N(6))-dimethyltransferase RsmA [Clostridia bacterium]